METIIRRELRSWTCRKTNKKICQSQHEGLFIVEHGNGFHTITSSIELMKKKYPPK